MKRKKKLNKTKMIQKKMKNNGRMKNRVTMNGKMKIKKKNKCKIIKDLEDKRKLINSIINS